MNTDSRLLAWWLHWTQDGRATQPDSFKLSKTGKVEAVILHWARHLSLCCLLEEF